MTTAQVRRGSRRRRCGRSVAVSRSSGSSITTSYCGDITGARATEGYLLIWLRMMAWAGGPHFNIAVHRG